MRAAARSQIEIGDLDHAQLACARRLFAQRQRRRLCRRDLAKPDRTTLPNDLVGEIDGLLNSLIRRIVEQDVDLTLVFKHAKAPCRRVKHADEGRRKNVLTSVLLHMVEPSQPINFPVNCLTNLRDRTLDYVQNAGLFRVNAINDTSIAKCSCICRLAAAGGIEGGSIESHCDLTCVGLVQANDARVEFEQPRIVIIETLGRWHGIILVRSLLIFKSQSPHFADYTDKKLFRDGSSAVS